MLYFFLFPLGAASIVILIVLQLWCVIMILRFYAAGYFKPSLMSRAHVLRRNSSFQHTSPRLATSSSFEHTSPRLATSSPFQHTSPILATSSPFQHTSPCLATSSPFQHTSHLWQHHPCYGTPPHAWHHDSWTLADLTFWPRAPRTGTGAVSQQMMREWCDQKGDWSKMSFQWRRLRWRWHNYRSCRTFMKANLPSTPPFWKW